MFKTPHILYTKYAKQLIGLCLFIIAFLSVHDAMAQTYPVQTNVYVTPPYGKHLNDYYTTTKEKLVVSLINRDNLKPVLEVRLRMTITASNGLKIQSKEGVNYPTITLDAGIPTRLTQDDLSPYFLNINSQGYFDQGKLPDGQVEFTFQVIEKYTGKVLSAPATGRVWLSSQKPPLLRFPSNDEDVAFRDPINMKFQWEPQHKNLSQVEYEFELRELPDVGAAPQSVFMYAPVIHQERILFTSLIYDVMMPPLDPNKTYGWRVRAIAKDGVDELNMFENNGYSEIRWFRTQDNCPAPGGVTANLQGRRVDLNWFPGIGNNDFIVQYRPKYGTSEEWGEISTYENRASIYDISRGMTYEYRVGGICTTGKPVFSPVGEIMVPAVDSTRLLNCGIMPVINFDNKELLPELKAGDVVALSDYPMTVTMATGSNGTFSGEGWVPVNWLLETKWAVEFSNISVNTDYRMIRGSVRAKYDVNEGQIANIDEITDGGKESTKDGIIKVITVDFIIPENPVLIYNEEDEVIVIYSTDGQTKLGEIVPPKNEEGKPVFPVTVQDKKGNIHKIEEDTNPDGSVKTDGQGNPVLKSTEIGQSGDPIPLNSANKQNINADIAIVTFTKGNGVYAFDAGDERYKKVNKIKDEYEYLAQGKDSYCVPWKFLPSGGSDKVQAKIDIKANNIDLTKVIFATPQGTRFKATYDEKDNLYAIDLVAGEVNDEQEIYALYEESTESYQTLGKLRVITYKPQTNKLVIVQVNGNKINESELKEYLKKVYSPIAITWETRVEDYNYTGETDRFFKEGSGLLSAYNDKMKTLQSAYQSDNSGSFSSEVAYIFIMGKSGRKDDRNTKGFMPRGKQFGYIFKGDLSNKDNICQIISHELGHGRWRLHHTFDSSYGNILKEGTTEPHNLMDYTEDGVHLAKWQWARINDPAWFTDPFEGDEKGMKDIIVSDIWDKTNSTLVSFDITAETNFILPTGQIIRFTEEQISKIEKIYINEAGYLSAIGDKDYTYEHSRTVDGNDDDKLNYNGRFVSFNRLETDFKNENTESKKRREGITSGNVNIGGREYVTYKGIGNAQTSLYVLTSLLDVNFVDCSPGIQVLTRIIKEDGTSEYGYKTLTDSDCDVLSVSCIIDKRKKRYENLESTSIKEFLGKLGLEGNEDNYRVYLLDKVDNPDYERHLQEVKNDKNENVLAYNCDDKGIYLIYNNGTDGLVSKCYSDYSKQCYEKLHGLSLYQYCNPLEKIALDRLMQLHVNTFGWGLCNTGEEAARNKDDWEQFKLGVYHELISMVNVVDILFGVKEMAEILTKQNIDYITDPKNVLLDTSGAKTYETQTCLKAVSEKNLSGLDKLSAQADCYLLNAMPMTKTTKEMIFELADFIFNCDSVDFRDGTYNLCYHRAGRVVGFVLPIIVTEATGSATKLVKALRSRTIAGKVVNVADIRKVMDLLDEAARKGHVVKKQGKSKWVIESPENVTTVTMDERGVVNIVVENKALASRLSGSLKTIYDDLTNAGLQVEEKANTILFKNSKNETVALIYNNKFTPVKWEAEYMAKPKGYTATKLDDGYILLQKGDDIVFDLGFKEGRALPAEDCNNFMQIGKKADLMGQPYKAGTTVDDIILKENDIIYVVENYKSGTPNPGQFASKDKISTLKDLREKLAVKEAWKETGNQPTLRAYRVKKELRARSGIIGPQTEANGQVLQGGAHQYEILDYMGSSYKDFIEIIGSEKGIILK